MIQIREAERIGHDLLEQENMKIKNQKLKLRLQFAFENVHVNLASTVFRTFIIQPISKIYWFYIQIYWNPGKKLLRKSEGTNCHFFRKR